MLIAIEGLDASGKHTQSQALADRLPADLYSNPTYDTLTLAPTGRFIGAHLRQAWAAQRLWDAKLSEEDSALLNVSSTVGVPNPPPLDAFVFQCLMAVNKYELAPEVMRCQKNGNHVVLDRWWPSAYAYGVADGLDREWLYRIHASLPQPDLSVLLDIDHEQSVARRPERRDRYETQGADFYRQLRLNYLELWHYAPQRLPGRWVVINGRLPVEAVTQLINAEVIKTREEKHYD